jgi:hypothetical protein
MRYPLIAAQDGMEQNATTTAPLKFSFYFMRISKHFNDPLPCLVTARPGDRSRVGARTAGRAA